MDFPGGTNIRGKQVPTVNPETRHASSLVVGTTAPANARSAALRFSRPLDETEEFSALIGDVYDAALDAARWPAALDRAARFIGGRAAALYSKDAARKSGEFYYDNNCTDPHSRRLYREQYVQLDPTTIGHVFAEVARPMATEDLIPHSEYVETRFYQEWAQPQGLAYGISAVLDKTSSSAALFGVFREERNWAIDHETRQRMRRIVPHIRRATLIGRTIDLTRSESALLADTLDGVSAAVFIVDATGRVLFANESGRGKLAKADAVRVRDGRLAAIDPGAAALFHETFATAALGDTAMGAKGVAISLIAATGARHVAHVLPLTGGERRHAVASHSAVCAVFIREAALDSPSQARILASTFQLTPTELRVLLAIVDVGGVPEVAEALGVAESTVKTHLGRLYCKTGAGRQADLVKLVASFSSPLLN
jgi:DNA-binding CsgD family transcriptional regulator/PAS domain-containing protein